MSHLADLRAQVDRAALLPETQAVRALLPALDAYRAAWPKIRARAESYVTAIRAPEHAHPAGVEAFLQRFGLDTQEGVLLMRMAEALLRIPDRATADALIHDTLAHGNWHPAGKKEPSLLMLASSLGLELGGRVTAWGDATGGTLGAQLSRLASRLGETLIREALKAAMRLLGTRFVMGETIEDALTHSASAEEARYAHSFDMLGEGARSAAQGEHYFTAYLQAIEAVGRHNAAGSGLPHSISIKLSALHPRFEWRKRERVMAELLPRLFHLMRTAMQHRVAVSIDAEESTRFDLTLDVLSAAFSAAEFREYSELGAVVQAYQKRAFYTVDYLAELARECGKKMNVRLVKGAYWDSEIKQAQLLGLVDYPVFTRKEHTDLSYLACAQKILSHGEWLHPQFATHNALSAAAVAALAGTAGRARQSFEFQKLHGMGDALHTQIVAEYPCRVYAPVGPHRELLAYLIRRLLENGANSSFVHQLQDENLPMDALLADPLTTAEANNFSAAAALPLPELMTGPTRRHAGGVDFGQRLAWNALMTPPDAALWRAAAGSAETSASVSAAIPIYSPADTRDLAGHMHEACGEDIARAFTTAHAAWHGWSTRPAAEHASLLEASAEGLVRAQESIIDLLRREAGKTTMDAMAEWREAIDFCRYYAAEARRLFAAPQPLAGPTGEENRLSLHGRGVFACISPWNFPLAIFTGQVAAALAAGNCALAKPAEQTPLIATLAVRILHEAGIPREVVQLLPGRGDIVGAAMLEDARLAGVAFTGGTDTARRIAQSLAARQGPMVPFIAETGGQNAMIVDSSALLEQAVDDILLSAFGSAGQRCSALRVLYVQKDIAAPLLALLKGAMAELAIGTPLAGTTDIGPVIDRESLIHLQRYVERRRAEGRKIHASALPAHLPPGHYFTPHIIEMNSIAELEREIFGPVLHVAAFAWEELDAVITAINATGYGLTFGLHSRIAARVSYITERIRAGNIYVNRSMTGAVVGVQPFGGEGLSGTGPKAGGPHTLLRFATERTVTVNTAAAGGNVTLLAGKN